MADTFLGGLVERFDATVKSAQALPKGLYLGQAKDGAALPLVVLKHVPPGDEREWTFEDENNVSDWLDTGRVAFLVFAETAKRTEQIAKEISTVFARDWNLIVVKDATVEQFLQVRYWVDNEEERSAAGELVFRAEVEFEHKVNGGTRAR